MSDIYQRSLDRYAPTEREAANNISCLRLRPSPCMVHGTEFSAIWKSLSERTSVQQEGSMNSQSQSNGNVQVETPVPILERHTGSREYPLSLNQQHMWFQAQLDMESNLWNLGAR